MNISGSAGGSSLSVHPAGGISKKNKEWKLTDSLKEKITKMAGADARSNTYMGDGFLRLRKAEVSKAGPNRAALIGKLEPSMLSGGIGDTDGMKAIRDEIREADERWMCMLFGVPYEAQVQSDRFGSSIHVYDENGDEILTYTQGSGWHAKESRSETEVHQAMKSAYYEAYHAARQELKAEAVPQETFRAKA